MAKQHRPERGPVPPSHRAYLASGDATGPYLIAAFCAVHGPLALAETRRAAQLVRQYRIPATPCLQCACEAIELPGGDS